MSQTNKNSINKQTFLAVLHSVPGSIGVPDRGVDLDPATAQLSACVTCSRNRQLTQMDRENLQPSSVAIPMTVVT